MKRFHGRPWYVYAIAIAVAVAGAYLSFELGRYQAGYSVLDHRRELAAANEGRAELERTAEELRRQVAILETSKEIDRETYAQVKADLSELQAKIQAQEEELVFYRGIVSPQDGVAGLRIQSVDVLPSDAERRYLLRLVLVQAIVHSRKVAGAVRLQVEGTLDGQPASHDVRDLITEGGVYDMDFEFRYFQGLECEIVLPVGFEPERLLVEIVPSEKRAEHVNQTFQWAVIAG
jgi:hypothetical protein